MSACRHIEIWGGPRERGFRYGVGAADEIGRGTSHYLGQMHRAGLTESALEELVEAYLPLIHEYDETYVDEMRGIAEGADVPFASIVLMNARTELLKLAGNPVLRAGLLEERGADGCSTIIVQPERSRDGKLIHAHNWDWKESCAEDCVILSIRNDDGPDMLTFTEAGGLARFGFNSVGISITGNYLECDRDYRRIGVPLALIRRKVLQQENPSLAFDAIYSTRKSASNNLAMAHAPSGIVFDLECAPDETFVIEPSDGLLVHTNHWLSPVALAKLRETGVADSPCSHFRQQRLMRLLGPTPHIGHDDIGRVLLDTEGTPLCVCVPPRASSVTGRTATVASLIMTPEEGVMDVAMRPYAGANYARYAIAGHPAERREPLRADA